MIYRSVLEWQAIRYGDGPNDLPVREADRIAAIAAALPLAKSRGNGIVEHGRSEMRVKGIVGVIASESCAIEILPKIDLPGVPEAREKAGIRRRLIDMLSVALDLQIDVGQMTALNWQRDTLLEILIRIFAGKLTDGLRQGMPRRYLERQEDLPTLRGRLDLMRQSTVLAFEPSRFACRYDELTTDIPLNQIMKAAVNQLSRVSRDDSNLRLLRELGFAYSDISKVSASSLRWDQVVLDRTNRRWRELLNLARMILGERFQTTSLGGAQGFSLLFDMSALFEEYVARMLKRALLGTDLRVVSQGGRLFCLEDEKQRGVFQTRPDILIKRADDVVQIIDTKWKKIAPVIDDPKRGVAQNDVYQMMAYGQLYNCDRLTLLYPHHEALGITEGVITAHKVVGTNRWLEIASVDMGRNELLSNRIKAVLEIPPVRRESIFRV